MIGEAGGCHSWRSHRRDLSRTRKRRREDQTADKASGTQRARKPEKAS